MAKYKKFEKLLDENLDDYEKEYRLFAKVVGFGEGIRKRLKEAGYKDFRYDYKVGDDLLVEIQGHGYSHGSRRGQKRDWKKNNDAIKEGYRVLYFPASMVKSRPDIVMEEILECL